MWILDAITDMFKKKGITVTMDLGSGYNNPRNRTLLIQTQDAIWASGQYMPTYQNGVETTYCNLAVQNVFSVYGYHKMDGMTADQMMVFIRSSQDFKRQKIDDCQFAANMWTVIVAGMDGQQLGQGHGHVCTLTPGAAEWSGHWNAPAPQCLSIGRLAICARSKGINWAFVPEPELWAWIPSLGE